MIKLTLTPKPKQLTPAKEKELVQQFIDSVNKNKKDKKKKIKAVWKKPYIQEALLKMTHEKCAYSEVRLNVSDYMEIEHIIPKTSDLYKVVSWGNLVPSCKRCNLKKSSTTDEIVNPLADEPKDYMYFQGFRYYKRVRTDNSAKGDNSIRNLDLNYYNFTLARGTKALFINKYLRKTFLYLKYCVENNNTTEIPQEINELKKILRRCNSTTPFSAAVSTFILYESARLDKNVNFQIIEVYLKNNNFWDDEFQRLKDALVKIAMPL